MVQVTVEFYGIPRQRAGRQEIVVSASTVGGALKEVARACPALKNLLQSDGRLSPHYLVSIGGQEFVSDLGRLLQSGDEVVLFSADAGG